MDKEAQRIAIAEACGWTNIKERLFFNDGRLISGSRNGDTEITEVLPDYFNDLNAIHDAVMTLDRRTLDYSNYCSHLNQIVALENWKTVGPVIQAMDATARQRCEAFLRTLNLWTDPAPANK